MCDESEGADVAKEDTCQDDVAKLTTGGLHHRRVAVLDEDQGDK